MEYLIQFGAPLKPILHQTAAVPHPSCCHVNQFGLYTRHCQCTEWLFEIKTSIFEWQGNGFKLEIIQNTHAIVYSVCSCCSCFYASNLNCTLAIFEAVPYLHLTVCVQTGIKHVYNIYRHLHIKLAKPMHGNECTTLWHNGWQWFCKYNVEMSVKWV